ncbi:hypothetical protein V9K67_05805 [Paraflavisolibacter sp. H34]|uniref:hypothetical protein n=1 Tax=Huijunlia imazamoxiresistens TaxID=3127457 RepID=UPI00301B66E7
MSKVIYRLSNIKVIFKTLNSYKTYSVNRKKDRYAKLLKATKAEIGYGSLQPAYEGLLNKLIYKNEDWNIVKHRFHDRFLKFFNLPVSTADNVCVDNKTVIEGNDIYVSTSGLKDDWIYYYLDDTSLKNYELKFKAVFHSKFREIQFGFRYHDFYNRYRFRIEDNCLHFDVVSKGQFYNSLLVEPFAITVGETYSFAIVVKDSKFSFVSNGKVVMTVDDKLKLFNKGAVAFILWDDCGDSNIQTELKNIELNPIK